jgi:hypothetical protein
MAVKRRRPRRRDQLSPDLELILECGSPLLDHQEDFEDEEDQRRAWKDHGQRITWTYRQSRPCQRPWGYWHYDLKKKKPLDFWTEAIALLRLGELDADEREFLRDKYKRAREYPLAHGVPPDNIGFI